MNDTTGLSNPDYFDYRNWVEPSCPECGSEDVDIIDGYDKAFDCNSCDAEAWF